MAVYPHDCQDGGPYRCTDQMKLSLSSLDHGHVLTNGNPPAVVNIQARFRNAKTGAAVWMMASGCLIGPNLVITAGHVVYDLELESQGGSRDQMLHRLPRSRLHPHDF